MSRTSDLMYVTVITDNADEAVSLAEYLNQHGVLAHKDGTNEITCPISDPTKATIINELRRSWRLFWEHSDSGLFGLPIYIKNS